MRKLFTTLMLIYFGTFSGHLEACSDPTAMQVQINSNAVTFSWSGTGSADVHAILLWDKNKNANSRAFTTKDAVFTTTDIPNGNYRWRVIALCNTGNSLTDHSEWIWGDDFDFSGQCPSPSTAQAGADQSDVSGTSTILSAAAPSRGTGTWTIVSGTGGSIGDTGSNTSTFTGTAGTTYVLRWTVSNACGSNYDEVTVSFEVEVPASVTDIDGNTYSIVKIGRQIWMAENLKVAKYNDGTIIPNVTDDAAWVNLTTGAWVYHSNTASNNDIYGKLYNQYAVNTGKLCPTGWHIPTNVEWVDLTNYLGGSSEAGGKMKSTGNITEGTGLWNSPNTGTNESGFTGLPGSYRGNNGRFYPIGFSGTWWSATQIGPNSAGSYFLDNSNNNIYSSATDKMLGMSCRCVKD